MVDVGWGCRDAGDGGYIVTLFIFGLTTLAHTAC